MKKHAKPVLFRCMPVLYALVSGILSGCTGTDSDITPAPEDGRFYINASVKNTEQTKTVFDPSDLHVDWSDDDSLAVLVRAGSGAWSHYAFEKAEGQDKFYCDIFSPAPGQEYEFCILYPYDEDFTSAGDDLTGNVTISIGTGDAIRGGKDRIETSYPLCGHIISETESGINVILEHASALFEITLANSTEGNIEITGLELSSDSGHMLSGDFRPAFGTSDFMNDGKGSEKATAAVTDGIIAPGETAVFYMDCAPFSLSAEDSFSLEVLTSGNGTISFPCDIPENGCQINAGSRNRITREIGEAFYRKVTSGQTDWEGDYLITYTSAESIKVLDGYEKTYGTGYTDLAQELTENGISAGTGDKYRAEIRKFMDGYSIYVTGIGYIGYTGTENSLARNPDDSPSGQTDVWNISSSEGLSPANSPDRTLKWNVSAPRFACYKSSSGNCEPVTLYKRSVTISSGHPSDPDPDPDPDPEPEPEPDPDPQPGDGANSNGWLMNPEVPSASVSLPEGAPYSETVSESYSGALAYVYETENPDQLIVTHTFTEGGERYRNYTLLFDRTKKASLWVAFGMHKNVWDGNSGRKDSWKDDPAIPSDWQSRGCSSPYSRGHQIASGDRQVSVTANKQTFYHSNQAPQWQNGFNGGVWSSLENAIQGSAPTGRDTMYVVTGPVFEDGVTIKDKEGITIPLPVAYWKCIMLCSFDSSGNMTGAKGIGYYFPGNESFSGKYGQFATTIDEIEEICGFDLYANVPKELQDSAESVASELF